MKKFMLLYWAPMSAEQQVQNAGSSDGQKGMEMWMNWFGQNGANIVEGGTPLGMGMNYSKSGGTALQAPYIGGYSIVQAEDLKGVESMLREHPHLMLPGASIQVLEMLPTPGSSR